MKISLEAQKLYDFLPPISWMTKERMARAIGCRSHKITSLKKELEEARLIVIRYKRNGNRQNPHHEIIKISPRGTPICKHINRSYALSEWAHLDRNSLIECYLKSEWNIVPFAGGKKRILEDMSLYHWRQLTGDEKMDFFFNNPQLNVGLVVCAHMTIVDVETKDNHWTRHEDFQNTLTVATARGCHKYFRKDTVVAKSIKAMPDIDILCGGSLVVLPPSIHPSGQIYRWETIGVPKMLPIEFRREWREQDFESRRGTGNFVTPSVIYQGARNDTLWKMGRSLRWRGATFYQVEASLITWNRTLCVPRLSMAEMENLIKNVWNRADRIKMSVRSREGH